MLASHNTSYFKGEAVLTEHPFGAGRVLHLGAAFSVAMVRKLLAYTGVAEPLRQIIEAPETVEQQSISSRNVHLCFKLFLRNPCYYNRMISSSESVRPDIKINDGGYSL